MEQLKKILIIDDDDRNIFALQAVLKSKGYRCVSAVSAREGLEKIRSVNDIGIALIDMMMPEMDGYEMIKVLRETDGFSTLPLIAVTAQAMVGDKEKCLQAGADDYISKPVNVEALINIIQQHITLQ